MSIETKYYPIKFFLEDKTDCKKFTQLARRAKCMNRLVKIKHWNPLRESIAVALPYWVTSYGRLKDYEEMIEIIDQNCKHKTALWSYLKMKFHIKIKEVRDGK